MLLQQGISEQAQRRPEAVALVYHESRLSYGELETQSNRLAAILREHGCERGDRVALLMPKTPSAIIAMVGVLKADAIYVPLDASGPVARSARMLEAADCRFVLGGGPVQTILRDALAAAALPRPPLVGWLDQNEPPPQEPRPAFAWNDVTGFPDRIPLFQNSDQDIAHILFTSGSTGTPKGVMITHANVLQFIGWAARYFGTSPSDRISQHTPLHFDLSTFDVFCTLNAGAQLHLVPQELNLLPHKLAQFIRDGELTQWFSVPSVFNFMAKFNVIAQHDFPSLRRALWCGEAIPTPTLVHWMRKLPHVRFTNLYGPTETTIASSYYTVPECPSDPRAAIPIGSPCDGEELLLLDEQLRPVPPGEIGNLYIAGRGLSPGYWRDAEKTAAAFLQRPGSTEPGNRIYRTGDLARQDEHGLFYFLGRRDTQIKSRGYRIELGEIEAALHALPGLRESAVVAIQSQGFEGSMICCAYVPAEGNLTVETLRKRLGELVPAYMLPVRWLAYDTLPKNANGKIDRPQLRADFAEPDTTTPLRMAPMADALRLTGSPSLS